MGFFKRKSYIMNIDQFYAYVDDIKDVLVDCEGRNVQALGEETAKELKKVIKSLKDVKFKVLEWHSRNKMSAAKTLTLEPGRSLKGFKLKKK